MTYKPTTAKPVNIDEYMAGFSPAVQEYLQHMRDIIRSAVPLATEAIKYGIPTFIFHGNLVSYAAWKNHIGLYPAPRTSPELGSELAAYGGEKSTVHFPYDRLLPVELIKRIAHYNADHNVAKQKGRKIK